MHESLAQQARSEQDERLALLTDDEVVWLLGGSLP